MTRALHPPDEGGHRCAAQVQLPGETAGRDSGALVLRRDQDPDGVDVGVVEGAVPGHLSDVLPGAEREHPDGLPDPALDLVAAEGRWSAPTRPCPRHGARVLVLQGAG